MEGAKIYNFAAEREARGRDTRDALMQELFMLELEYRRYDKEFAGMRRRDLDPEVKTRWKGLENRRKEMYLLLRWP